MQAGRGTAPLAPAIDLRPVSSWAIIRPDAFFLKGSLMRIPYGVADFRAIREDNLVLVDKSRYIRLLESPETGSYYVAWLRPRRFGKSVLLSMLCAYYDLALKDQFERLFGDLEIGQNPTPERSRYLILRMEFTGLNTVGTMEDLERSFTVKLQQSLTAFFEAYQHLLPAQAEAFAQRPNAQSPAALMSQFVYLLKPTHHKVYVLIDEYDNFTNDLVFRGRHKTYEAVLHGSGFLREFFKILKEGAGLGVISRIFITGVSPVTLDDLGSGANIFSYPFLRSTFQAMTAFTEEEVRGLLIQKLEPLGLLDRLESMLKDIRLNYDGYRFCLRGAIPCFNPDMVLFFLSELGPDGSYPQYLLDVNLRMDYGKLRALMAGNQSAPRPDAVQRLLEVLETGVLKGDVQPLFPLTRAWEPDFFPSLLFYHGLVTFDAVEPTLKLVVPNYVIKELLWENLRGMLEDVFQTPSPALKLEAVLQTLAIEGDPLPFARLVQAELFPKLSNRDLIRFRESSVKLLFLAWLSHRSYQVIFSEWEHVGGYSDLILVPNPKYPWTKAHVLLELKYVKLAVWEKRGLAAVEEALAEGEAQLLAYASDPRLEVFRGAEWTRLTLAFVGRREIYYRAPGEPTQRLEPEPEPDFE